MWRGGEQARSGRTRSRRSRCGHHFVCFFGLFLASFFVFLAAVCPWSADAATVKLQMPPRARSGKLLSATGCMWRASANRSASSGSAPSISSALTNAARQQPTCLSSGGPPPVGLLPEATAAPPVLWKRRGGKQARISMQRTRPLRPKRHLRAANSPRYVAWRFQRAASATALPGTRSTPPRGPHSPALYRREPPVPAWARSGRGREHAVEVCSPAHRRKLGRTPTSLKTTASTNGKVTQVRQPRHALYTHGPNSLACVQHHSMSACKARAVTLREKKKKKKKKKRRLSLQSWLGKKRLRRATCSRGSANGRAPLRAAMRPRSVRQVAAAMGPQPPLHPSAMRVCAATFLKGRTHGPLSLSLPWNCALLTLDIPCVFLEISGCGIYGFVQG